MKIKIRSIIALILVLCTAMSLFACGINFGGGNGTPTTDETEDNDDKGNGGGGGAGGTIANTGKSRPTNVYRETPVSIGEEIESMWSAIMYEGRIYHNTNTYDDMTGANIIRIMSISTADPSDTRTHLELEFGYRAEEGIYSSSYMNSFAIAPDGAVWVNIQSYYEDYTDPNYPIYESNNDLRRYDSTGALTLEIKSSELMPDRDYVYFGSVIFHENLLFVTVETEIVAINTTTGRVEFSLTDNNNYLDRILPFSDGRLGVMLYDNATGERLIKTINTAAKSWGETISLATSVYLDYVMPGDSNYLVYYVEYGKGVLGLKSDGTSEEIVNFLNSDIDSSNVSNVMKLDDGDFLMFTYDYESGYGEMRAMRLTKVPDDEVRESIMLTYACMYLDYTLRRKILTFNKTNGEYRIQMKDYSEYNTNENYNAGYDRLNADIIGGKIPDMMSLNGLDFRTYANKGILADLYELMESSKTVNRDDYTQNVLKAAEYNGKLYRFVPEYSIQTTAGKKSIFGNKNNWTFDDFEALLAQYPNAKLFSEMTRDEVLNQCLTLTVDSYIDWDTGKCSFDEGFIKLLELAKSYPETIDWDAIYNNDPEYWSTRERNFAENRVLLTQAYVSSYRSARDFTQFGEDITFVGYPTSDGNGSVFYSYLEHGVSASSPHKQVCFDFLASTVETTPDFQNSGGYFWGSFSISKAYMEAVREYEQIPLRQRPGYIDYEGDAVRRSPATGNTVAMPMPNPDYIENDYEKNYHMTKEEIAVVDRLLESTTTFTTQNTAVMNIIMEEAAEFFAGRRSASDTARIVQSRVQILVSESM